MGKIALFSGSTKDLLSHYSAYSLNHNRELIFIDCLKELESRIEEKNPYALVRKASILRLILLTDGGYYLKVNNYNLKFKFKYKTEPYTIIINNAEQNEKKIFTTYKLSFDEETEELPIDKFLNQTVMVNKNPSYVEFLKLSHIDEEYTVLKIINLIANAHGGVHIEKTWKDIVDGHKIFADETSPFNINFNSRLHDIIDDISTICIKAMKPLVDKINSQESKPLGIILKSNTSNVSNDEKYLKINKMKYSFFEFIKRIFPSL